MNAKPLPSSSEPTHVSIILGDAVRVRRADRGLEDFLRDEGYQLRPSQEGLEVLYTPSGGGGDLKNEELIALLRLLAARGVAFARDYKQLWSPAAVVSELIEAGTSFDDPKAAGFDGSVWLLWKYPWSSD